MTKITHIFILTAILLTSPVCATEKLKPQSFLGLVAQADTTGNVVVQRVLPQATADAVGLQIGDVIQSINQKPISSFEQIIALVKEIGVSENIEVAIVRQDKAMTLKGAMQGKARESHAEYDVLYDVVEHQGDSLRSIVYQPKNMKSGDKRPAMFYIQGYTCQSIDHAMVPNLTMQQLLDAVVLSGMVVYKMEKLGVGDSQGKKRCEEVDFSTEMAGFESGIKALKSYDFVNAEQVFIFGHSLGGVYAPFLAEKYQLAGVAVYGAVIKPWYEYMLDIFGEQSVMMGTPKATAEANVKNIQPLLSAWLNSNQSWSQLQNNPSYKAGWDSGLLPVQGEQILQRHFSFFRDLNRYDLKTAWKNSRQPVLAIHGEFDIQAISENWAHDLVAVVNEGNKVTATAKVIKNTDHGLMRYDDMQALQADMSAGSYSPGNPGQHYNSDVAQVLIDWMAAVLKK
ncbi:PDZ domain-containing protein [Marinicella rhabdoformis]|uniref:PDZ domain-containing protein n=1 Tax=Marinicella rhabdoformis TaxID=2580566 RepID=UPI0012AECD61|nr:PDZ domain-containing protein [Marinicella rhabdoformis]